MTNYYRCTAKSGGGGGTAITDYWTGNESAYEAISPKLATTEYIVTTEDRHTYRIYHGSTLVFPNPSHLSDYDFYIEDVNCYGEVSALKFWTATTENIVKSWRMDLKATAATGGTVEIIGSQSGSGANGAFELFMNNTQWRIYAIPSLSGDRDLTNLNGLDVTIIKDNGKLSFYTRSGSTLTLIKEFDYDPTTGGASQNYFLGRYKTTYSNNLHFDYFGFKILEQEAEA